MSKTSNKILATVGATATAALLFAAVVINYDTPNYTREEMRNARYDLECAENRYWMVHDYAVDQSYDTLKTDKQYNKLYNKLVKVSAAADSVWINPDADWSQYSQLLKQADALTEQCDSLAGELRSAHIDNNIELKYASENLRRAAEYVEQMERDSVRADSIAKIPLTVRFEDNWNKIRTKYHLNRIASHQQSLQELQR
ncbi:MAG: hypothetical protein IKW09_03090 [Alphaproteobacteria bacterium]|nr:hypothetical protein [Alphaproteobacteria bacterium]